MKNNTQIAQLRNTLLSNGYTPLPLEARSKRCLIVGWSKDDITADWLVEKTHRHQRKYASTGLRTDRLAAFDIDILDEDLALEAEELLESLIGETELCRIGRAPKRLLLYQMTGEPPFKSCSSAKYGEHRIELLCGSGRQFVTDGIHEVTDKPYYWEGATPEETPLAELPAVDYETACNAFDALEALLEATGLPKQGVGRRFGDSADVYDLTDDFEIQLKSGDVTTWGELAPTLDEAGEFGNIRREDGEFGDSDGIHFMLAKGSGEAIAHDFTRDQVHRVSMQMQLPPQPSQSPLQPGALTEMQQTWAMIGDGTARMIDDPATALKYEHLKAITEHMTVRTSAQGRPALAYVAWRKHSDTVKAHRAALRPDYPDSIIVQRGKTKLFNTYRRPRHPETGGEIETVSEFITHLIPDPTERQLFWDWHALKVANPGNRQHALLIVAQTTGTGRGTWFQILRKLFTPAYVRNLELADLIGSGTQSQYNQFLSESLMLCISEVLETNEKAGYMQSRRIAYERFKAICELTPTEYFIKRKTIGNTPEMCFASLIMATNHIDAFAVDAGDRRLLVIDGNEKPLIDAPNNLKERIHKWMESDANIGALHRGLLKWAGSGVEYNPTGAPLLTAARKRMITEGMSPVDRAYDWIVENAKGDLATMYQCLQMAKQAALEWDLLLPADPMGQMRHVLQKRAKKPLKDQIRMDKTKVRPWILRNYGHWDDDQISLDRMRSEVSLNGPPGGSVSIMSNKKPE